MEKEKKVKIIKLSEEFGCDKCENLNKFPRIYWSKDICTNLEYNEDQTKCVNFTIKKEVDRSLKNKKPIMKGEHLVCKVKK